jgi:hypothetical protein
MQPHVGGDQGISVGSWNTKPSRRAPTAFAAPACSHSILPLDGSLRPAMMRSAVDLPQPEGPSSDTNSPGQTSRLSRSSATTPLAKLLPTPLSVTTGAPEAKGEAAEWSDTLQYRVVSDSRVTLQGNRMHDG